MSSCWENANDHQSLGKPTFKSILNRYSDRYLERWNASVRRLLKSDVMQDLMTSRGLRLIPQEETVYCTLPHDVSISVCPANNGQMCV
jgi:hypothetical protein